MEWLAEPQAWIALLTLTVLEVVLGIDNVIFISILAGKLPAAQQRRARTTGLAMAMIMRILLLLSLAWIVRLTSPLFEVLGQEISGRDLILLAGGVFLLAKATHEIHDKLEGEVGDDIKRVAPSFVSVIVQISLLDIVFSLDSVITAVGMADDLGVMITAVIVAVLIMLVSAGTISDFVNRHPTVKMLARSFLLLEQHQGGGGHVDSSPKGSISGDIRDTTCDGLSAICRNAHRPPHEPMKWTTAPVGAARPGGGVARRIGRCRRGAGGDADFLGETSWYWTQLVVACFERIRHPAVVHPHRRRPGCGSGSDAAAEPRPLSHRPAHRPRFPARLLQSGRPRAARPDHGRRVPLRLEGGEGRLSRGHQRSRRR